jgi:tripartite-type tricarboxylate transporter receptor subunit TctC
VLEKINADVNRALASPDTKERLAKLGGEPMKMSLEQFDAFLRKEHAVLGRLMRDAGAKPQ